MTFFFTSWIAIQKGEIIIARRQTREAEAQINDAWGQRNAAIQDLNKSIAAINQRVSKSEELRAAAERKLAEMTAASAKSASDPQAENTVRQPEPKQLQATEPTVEGLTAFIKCHLTNMERDVASQLPDYADGGVDFHDKPHATLAMIESERKQMSERFPDRSILKDGIKPQFTANVDSRYIWVATATFDYHWNYRARSGAIRSGVTRDVWKIVPSPRGYRILAEHSFDPATGASKD